MPVLNLILNSKNNQQLVHTTEFSYDDDNRPLPLGLFFPFKGFELRTGYILTERKEYARFKQLNPTADDNDVDSHWDFNADYVGILDKNDVVGYQSHGIITTNAKDELPIIQNWLDNMLAVCPQLSQLGELWFAYLQAYVQSLDEQAEFVLDLGNLFTEGVNFDDLMAQRFYDEFLFDTANLADNVDFIQGVSPLPVSYQSWQHNMQTQLALFKTLLPSDFCLTAEQQASINQGNQLRECVRQGKWQTFKQMIEVTNPRHHPLIATCALVATALNEDNPEGQDDIRLQRNKLWVQSTNEGLYHKAFSDQLRWCRELKSDQTDDAFKLYFEMSEYTLNQFPLKIKDPLLIKNTYANFLLDLSYYYVERNMPRKAFELLYPEIQIMSDDGNWQKVSANTRARLRANFEASQIHMRDNGEVLPDNVTMFSKLTKADEDWLDNQDDLFEAAMNNREAQTALDITHHVLAFLKEKEIALDEYRYVYWQIDQARALRNLGQYSEAITVLSQVIDCAKKTEHYHTQQQLPRAKLSLAICFNRQDLKDEAIATYEEMLTDPLVLEDNFVLAGAYANLASLLSEKNQFNQATDYYLKAEKSYLAEGQVTLAVERCWFAFNESKKMNDGKRQKEVLLSLVDNYQDTIDETVQSYVQKACDALSLVDDSLKQPKQQSRQQQKKQSKPKGFLGRLFDR